MLTAKDLPGAKPVESFAQRLGFTRVRITTAKEKEILAIVGFWVLGKDARSAAPALIEIIKTRVGDSRKFPILCLFSIEADKTVMLPLLVSWLKDSDPSLAAGAAAELIRYYPEEAENAGVYKRFPGMKISTNAPDAK
ncbi:MAG: hypothetical protein JWQ71_2429 [Pedosphaera sp.]|nr:hypothetical protein [Pedosphaera sp.]